MAGLLAGLYQECKDVPVGDNANLVVPTVRRYSAGCKRIVQLGPGVLTGGVLMAKPAEVLAYGPAPHNLPRLANTAKEAGASWTFAVAEPSELPPCDMLLIHRKPSTHDSLAADLEKAGAVSKYIAIAGTEKFGDHDEAHPGSVPPGWPSMIPPPSMGPGLWPAIGAFLRANDAWRLGEHVAAGIGLTVLVRVGGGHGE